MEKHDLRGRRSDDGIVMATLVVGLLAPSLGACAGNDGQVTTTSGASGSTMQAGAGGGATSAGGARSDAAYDVAPIDANDANDASGNGGASGDAVNDVIRIDARADVAAEANDGGTLCNAGDCTAFVGGFDGFVFEYPCASRTTFECSGAMCAAGALTVTSAMQVKGDADKIYQIDFRVRGVTESKNYTGGMRRATGPLDPGPTGGDFWYVGGTAPLSSYSSYELHVMPPVAGGPNDYFLNARDGTDEHDGTTWALAYAASIRVHGGGTITFKSFDSNCVGEMNCGLRPMGMCAPRTLDVSGAVPPAPAGLAQPAKDANGTPMQWLFIDVTDVHQL
jgi:hypothetical protein